ncbi:MAG: hypothetical protein Q4D06_02205 [Coriobacteriia bacterium]|nr:hypothetical protein [Coriobacteriia bacterium]
MRYPKEDRGLRLIGGNMMKKKKGVIGRFLGAVFAATLAMSVVPAAYAFAGTLEDEV